MGQYLGHYSGPNDYPWHSHKNLKKKLYKVCIKENSIPLVERLRDFVAALNTEELMEFLGQVVRERKLGLVVARELQLHERLNQGLVWGPLHDYKKFLWATRQKGLSRQEQQKDEAFQDGVHRYRTRFFRLSVSGILLDWIKEHGSEELAAQVIALQIEKGAKARTLIERVKRRILQTTGEGREAAALVELLEETFERGAGRISPEGNLYPWVVEHLGEDAAQEMARSRLEDHTEVLPVLRTLEQTLGELCPPGQAESLIGELKALRERIYEGSLPQLLGRWFNEEPGRIIEKRIFANRGKDGDAKWQLLLPLFTFPERMGNHLSYGMMPMATVFEGEGLEDADVDTDDLDAFDRELEGLESEPDDPVKPTPGEKGSESASSSAGHELSPHISNNDNGGLLRVALKPRWERQATAILWRNLWRYLLSAMFHLDGEETGPEKLKNWTRIQKAITDIRRDWALPVGTPLDHVELAVELVDRIGDELDIKDPGRFVEYIRAFEAHAGLEPSIRVRHPEGWGESDEFVVYLDLLEECIDSDAGLTDREQEIARRMLLERGYEYSNETYERIFGVKKPTDIYHLEKKTKKIRKAQDDSSSGGNLGGEEGSESMSVFIVQRLTECVRKKLGEEDD